MILRDDHDADWTAAADSTLERRIYYAQNWRADVIALLADNGRILERVRYEPYGTPFGQPPMDFTGSSDNLNDDYGVPDGDVDSDDFTFFNDATSAGSARADLTESSDDTNATYGRPDGDRDSDDFFYYLAIAADNEPRGRDVLSSSDLRNRKGYAGYEWDPGVQAGTPIYHIRNRVYMTETGRWSRRDPMGYVDGANLYQYVGSSALFGVDTLGLFSVPCPLGTDCGGGAVSVPPWDPPGRPRPRFPRPRDPWMPPRPAPAPGENCEDKLDEAKNDPRVQAAMDAARSSCIGQKFPTIRMGNCDRETGGYFHCSLTGPDSIVICRLQNGNCPGVYSMVNTLIHEIKHYQQSCRLVPPGGGGFARCREFISRSCFTKMNDELLAYCAEPRWAGTCDAAKSGDCTAAATMCQLACGSVTDWCFILPWQRSCYDICMSSSFECGHLVGTRSPVPPFQGRANNGGGGVVIQPH